MCFSPQRCALFSTSQLPKVVRRWCALCILTLKCASCHNCVHFFDISTSKSGPKVWCVFVHFDFEMCFAPQRCALFSTSQLPKVVRKSGALYILTSKCASRHNSVCTFSTSQLPKVVRTWCFCAFWLWKVLRAATACNLSSLIWPDGSAPAALANLLFDPPEPQNIGKTQCFATFLPFRAPTSSFFWLFLFSDLLSSALLFSILLLHLCFSSVHIVGSLTSKLPSISTSTPPLTSLDVPSIEIYGHLDN